MATLNELTYDILSVLKAGKHVDDDNLSKEQVAFWIRGVRAKLIKQSADKGNSVINATQTLECIDIELVDASDCCGLELGCALLRTVDEIPQPIQSNSGELIFSVTGANLLATSINLIPWERVPYWGKGRFNNNAGAAFTYQNRLYLFNSFNPGVINITGVWANPEDASNYSNCASGNSCFTWDSSYPVSETMLDDIKRIILDTNFKPLTLTQADNTNNNLDEIKK